MVTRVKNGVVSTDNEDDLPPGGFVKNRRTTKWPEEERPQKHKTSRHLSNPFKELGPTSPKEEPEIAVAKPPEEKEEREMGSNIATVKERKIPFPVPGFEICPLCGQYSKRVVINREPFWACIGCDNKHHAHVKKVEDDYRVYAEQMAVEIAAGKDPVVLDKVVQSKPEWILAQLDVASIEKELMDARFTMELHNKRALRRAERIAKRVQTAAEGKGYGPEVLSSLRTLYEKEVTEEDVKNAKRDGTLVRYLNAWFQAAKKLKLELEQKLAEKSTPPAPATEIITLTPVMTTAVLVVAEAVAAPPEPVETPILAPITPTMQDAVAEMESIAY